MVRIENWSIIQKPLSHYDAPECNYSYLQGTVFGHPSKKDGTKVITSKIVLSHKTIVATQSGNLYRLGQPSKDYLEWLEKTGILFDCNEPLKLVGPDELNVIDNEHDCFIENQYLQQK